jgi:hypothetical protein
VTCRLTIRRCAALIAAYAIALQAMLAAFLVPSTPTVQAAAFEICRSDTDADRAREPGHARCSACLAGHCAGTATPARDAVAADWPTGAAALPMAIAALAHPPADRRHRPHAPRAPPLG